MKTLTYIQINPDGDSYDIIAVDDKILISGDYYHDKISSQFEGIKLYLDHEGIEYTVVEKRFPEIEDEDPYEASPSTESLKKYLSQLQKRGYIERV